jgi:CRP/FNR family transcriptional regulator, anaerobic regulatory protein
MDQSVHNHCEDCPTRRLCLAAGLEQDALRELSACVRPSQAMHKGDFLYRSGDPARDCFVVRSGSYKTFTLTATGDEYVTGFYFPGELVGVSGLAEEERPDSAMALETSTACRLRPEDVPNFWRIGSGQSLLRLIGQNEQLGVAHHMTLSHSSADARVAGFLLSLSHRMQQQRRDHRNLPLPMSRTDLANYLGMTLESLSRVLSRLGRAGLVEAARTRVTLIDTPGLQTVAGFPEH